MGRPSHKLQRFFRELKRRNVYKVAIAYVAVAFVGLQAVDLLIPATTLPAWADSFFLAILIIGFPVSLVVAWAFEMTPEGVRRTADAELVEEDPAGAGPRTRTAYKVLVGLGLVGAAVAGGWYLTGGGGGQSSEISEGTVAVLPFEVTGSGTEDWRDGMVSLLSTGLDGAAGLRAIPDRTVLAAWEAEGLGAAGAATEQALAVARKVDARYGVVGTAAGLGSELQLSAAAYETSTGDRLGQVKVSGAAKSVTALVGELSQRVLGLLAAETGEGLRAAHLASVTTRSDTALRAFLAGERHLRNAEFESAVMDYEAAIRADNGFALPYARIGRRGAWHGALRGQYIRRAHELSDQLPQRQRRLVRALYLAQIERRTLAAADSMRRLTEDYPDDPSIWENLGELVAHVEIPQGVREVETTHERAVELDPGHAPHFDHYVEAAFHLKRDSAVIARRVGDVPNEKWRRLYRLGIDVIFGDSARRQQAISAYDSVSIPSAAWPTWAPYLSPEYGRLKDTVLRQVLGREDIDSDLYAFLLVANDLQRGQIEQALADLRQMELGEDLVACRLARALTLGYPVPDSTAARYLAPANLPDEPSSHRFVCSGLYLVESGRGGKLDGLIRRLEGAVDTTGTDGISAGQHEAIIQELRGYRAWKWGDLERAAQLWDRSNESAVHGAIWRGDLHRERGRLGTAEGWYAVAWSHPVAHERLGQLYEEMGRPEEAAAAYRRFIEAWKDADEELQPRVEAARGRLQQLTASKAEPDE